MNISWGVGIEHEVVMLRERTDTISGRELKRNFNFENYSDEAMEHIRSQIRRRSNYITYLPKKYHDESEYLTEIIDINPPIPRKYKKLLSLVDAYCKLFKLSGHPEITRETVVYTVFQSIACDSTLHLRVPEFITPDLYYAKKPLTLIAQEMILKQKILLEIYQLQGTPAVYAPHGFIYPLRPDDDSECYVDYGGSYHLNMSLPYDHRILSQEEVAYQTHHDKVILTIENLFTNNCNWDKLSPLVEYGSNQGKFIFKLQAFNKLNIYHTVISKLDIPHQQLLSYYQDELDWSQDEYRKLTHWSQSNQDTLQLLGDTYQDKHHDRILNYLYIKITKFSVTYFVDISDQLCRLGSLSNYRRPGDIQQLEYIPELTNSIRRFQLFGEEHDQIPEDTTVFIRFNVSGDDNDLTVIPECSYVTSDDRIHSNLLPDILYYFAHLDPDQRYLGGGPDWDGPTRKIYQYFQDSVGFDVDGSPSEAMIRSSVSFTFDVLYGVEHFMLSYLKSETIRCFKDLNTQNNIYIKYTTSNYHQLHHEWAVAIQWALPLLMSALSSCDPFSIGDGNKLSELSLRIFISGYNFVNLTNLKRYYLPTRRHPDQYQQNSRLKSKVIGKFQYHFQDDLQAGNEFRVDPGKGFGFGFELRALDNFPVENIEYVTEFLFLLADHIHTPDKDGNVIGMVPENPVNHKEYDLDILKILSQGWNTPMPRYYLDALDRNLKLKPSITRLVSQSRAGASPYTYDVVNAIYAWLQTRYIDLHTGKGTGKYGQYVIDRPSSRCDQINKFPNINRRSWTDAFHQLYWAVEPKTQIRQDIEAILGKIHSSQRRTSIVQLRKKLQRVLLPRDKFKYDIDDVIYSLEDLGVLNLERISGIIESQGEWLLPGD